MQYALAALLTTFGALGVLASAEETKPREAFLDRCVAIQREIDEQRGILNDLFLAALAEGAESGAWTEADRNVARDAYAELLRPIAAEAYDPAEVQRRSKAKHTPDRRGLPPSVPMRTTSAVESWFLTRHYYLDGLFDQVTEAHAEAAVLYAEELWLQAKKASDLAPAVRPLLDVRERGSRWPSVPQQRQASWPGMRPGPGVSSVRLRSMEAFEAWSIVASPDGLLPPDPETTPENVFSEWKQTWEALRRIQHLFIARPRIAARYDEVISERSEAKRKAEEALIALVLKDAPIAEIESAINATARYYSLPPQPGRPRPWTSPSGPIADYRSFLTGAAQISPPTPNDPRQSVAKWSLASYLAWRKANEARTDQVQRLQQELIKYLPTLPAVLAVHIQRQIAQASDAKEQAKPKEKKEEIGREPLDKASDVDALIAQLQSIKTESESSPAASYLPGLFAGLQSSSQSLIASDGYDDAWIAIAASRGGGKAFALREKIARARVKELNFGSEVDRAETPLIAIYREALEEAAEAGQIPAVETLLAQCNLFSIMPRYEAQEWTRLLPILKAPDGSPLRQRESIRGVVANSQNPAVMRIAAMSLKKSQTTIR